MTDVVRELQSLAELAGRSGAEDIVLASRRLQSLLERLRNQFLSDVAGPGAPRARPIPIQGSPENA